MKLLPDTFHSDGFDFRLLKRDANVALLVKSKPGCVASYEVVKLMRVPAREMFGRPVEAHEAMPASEQWGQRGWSYPNRDQAEVRFRKLTGISTGAEIPRISNDEGQNSLDAQVVRIMEATI